MLFLDVTLPIHTGLRRPLSCTSLCPDWLGTMSGQVSEKNIHCRPGFKLKTSCIMIRCTTIWIIVFSLSPNVHLRIINPFLAGDVLYRCFENGLIRCFLSCDYIRLQNCLYINASLLLAKQFTLIIIWHIRLT